MHMPMDGVQLISSRQTELHICGIELVGAHKLRKAPSFSTELLINFSLAHNIRLLGMSR